MGAHFWSHHAPYQKDFQAALDALREREFRAGRFHQPLEIPPGFFGRLFGRQPSRPKPPTTISEAIKLGEVDACGTRSVLDMERIGDSPDFGVAWLIPRGELQRLFGTDQPTHKMVEESNDLPERIERGHGVCVVTYANGRPNGIYFAGYSYD